MPPEFRQADSLTTKQAFYPLLGFTLFALLWALILPGQTGAWTRDWYQYWVPVWCLGMAAGVLLKVISYFKRAKPQP